MTLPPIPDLHALTSTREALHAIAEHVLAPYRYRIERRIGLVATDAGFGTPELGEHGRVRVEGRDLVVERGGDETRSPITTIGDAAARCGIEPGAPDVYPPVTPLEVDTPLTVVTVAAELLAAWFELAWTTLDDLGDESPTLWPEHFDAAIELGDQDRGQRGTFGASPGDAEHPTPYLYVTHWAEMPDDEFWNDSAFPGASLAYDVLVTTSDPADAARDFFERGRAVLERR